MVMMALLYPTWVSPTRLMEIILQQFRSINNWQQKIQGFLPTEGKIVILVDVHNGAYSKKIKSLIEKIASTASSCFFE